MEHYRPKTKFPELEREYQNLLYACAACNRFKGSYWSDIEIKRVLNPCDHAMSQHLAFSNEIVLGRTARGTLNIDLLHLNNDESMIYRANLIEHSRLFIEAILSLKGSKKETDREWINRAVELLARLTHRSEQKVRSVLSI